MHNLHFWNLISERFKRFAHPFWWAKIFIWSETIVPYEFSTVSPNGRTKIIAIVGENFSFTRIDYFISKWKTLNLAIDLNSTPIGDKFFTELWKSCPTVVQLQSVYELVRDGLIAGKCERCARLWRKQIRKRFDFQFLMILSRYKWLGKYLYHSPTSGGKINVPYSGNVIITITQDWTIVILKETVWKQFPYNLWKSTSPVLVSLYHGFAELRNRL